MTVKKVYDQSESTETDEEQFTALLYATCTRFDIDGIPRVDTRRCVRCRCTIQPNLRNCEKQACADLQYQHGENAYTHIFNISLDFTDYTGTLVNCRLMDELAERVLGITLEEFHNLTTDQKTQLKWNYLLERCAVKVLVKRKTVCRTNIFILILDVRTVNLQEFVEKIKLY